jgi:hypothetical protein
MGRPPDPHAPPHAPDEPLRFGSGARVAHRRIALSRPCRLELAGTHVTLTTKRGVELDSDVSELVHVVAPSSPGRRAGLSFEALGKRWYVTFDDVAECTLWIDALDGHAAPPSAESPRDQTGGGH